MENCNERLREDVISAGRAMCAKGLVLGTGGNISSRVENGLIITPSGMDYMELVSDDLVEVSFDGRIIGGHRKPSVEIAMHSEILRARTDVESVVHTHSTYAVAVAATRRSIPVLTDNQAVLFGGEIPIADYAPIGSPKLAYNALSVLKEKRAVLLANHGVLCVGASPLEALFFCEMVEYFAKIFVLTGHIGGGVALSDAEVKFTADDMQKKYGQH